MTIKRVNINHIVMNDHGAVFSELIEIIDEGLRALGVDTSQTVNRSLWNVVNLMIGHTCFLSKPMFEALAEAPYIVFQVEALSEESGFLTRYPEYLNFLRCALQIFDYSETNVAFFTRIGINHVSYIPIGYSRKLERIKHRSQKDIEVLFYGAESPRRQNVLEDLRSRDVAVHWLFGCYGHERDDLIGRSKIILNMHQFEMRHLEQIRISYLLNNKCFVVSEGSDSNIYGEGVVFSSYEKLAETCASFLHPDKNAYRERIAELGYRNLKSVPMKARMKDAFEAMKAHRSVSVSLDHSVIPKPPVMIIGMHRSGTTLMTNMLRDLGLFIGHITDRNSEAILFLQINNWLLESTNSTWDAPSGLKDALKHGIHVRRVKEDIKKIIDKSGGTYLRSDRKVTFNTLRSISVPWGWKDPRNTFSLPVWISLFPNARIIHVKRHGVDVAFSVQRRQRSYFEEIDRSFRSNNQPLPTRIRIGGWLSTRRCTRLEGAFDLWEEYVTEAARHIDQFGQQSIEVIFEELVREPVRVLSEVCLFCNLDANAKTIESVGKRVDKKRRFAYRSSESLVKFSETVSNRLKRFGY